MLNGWSTKTSLAAGEALLARTIQCPSNFLVTREGKESHIRIEISSFIHVVLSVANPMQMGLSS